MRVDFRGKAFLAVAGVTLTAELLVVLAVSVPLSVPQVTLVALGIALAGALGLAFAASRLLGRYVRAIAASARACAAGEPNHPARSYESDELGTTAKVLDDTIRDLANRLNDAERHRARLAAILAGMHEGVLVVDADGRVQMVNRAVTTMLGLEGEAAIDRHYLESIRHPGIAGVLAEALTGTVPDLLEFQPARSPLRLVARTAPVGLGTSATGAVLVLHDVTELRRADLVRRDFVANVSHELRTPLTAIRGYVEALTDEPVDPAERQQFLEVIARQTTRMERLVKDLLRLASLDAREEPLDAAPCVLDDLVRGVVRDLSPSIERKTQQVVVSVAPEVPRIAIDAAKLQDALRNVVENASNYSPEGSRIIVSAERAGDHIVIRVEDEGPGLPAADLERIFERFYRVDKARSRESGGTGLGLSIVKHLIARLSGEVVAANRPGGGAAFTITLPLTPAEPRAETPI
jgi:signal transduction histidine kinase